MAEELRMIKAEVEIDTNKTTHKRSFQGTDPAQIAEEIKEFLTVYTDFS